jgi:hypothetical protein
METMRNHVRRLTIAGSLVLGVATLIISVAPLGGQAPARGAAPAPGQTTAPAPPRATPMRIPRTPDGHPDFNGIWQVMNAANYDLEAHQSKAAMAFQKGPYGPLPAKEVLYFGSIGAVPGGLSVVEGGQIPYKPQAMAKRKENQEHWLERDPEIKCYLPGVPRATYMPYPFQIFQSNSQFFIAYTYDGAVRNVYLKDPGPAQTPAWMGQSVGHWEGDTFVVNVDGFNGDSWFDRAGNYHSDLLKVTERYTLIDRDHVQYEAIITDPDTFTRPWKISMPLYRHIEPNGQLLDFKCVEFVEELVYGTLRKNPLPR